MGCDGGTIPTRGELVKEKKKAVRPDEENLNRIKWTVCNYSELPLREPIACDRLGNLFNLEQIIDGILKKSLPKRLKHIKGKKDLITLQMTRNPQFDEKKKQADGTTTFVAEFQCPVSNYEMNGKYGFVAIATCGHVISEKAHKEIKGTSCVVCGKEFTPDDVIPLNPSPERQEELKQKLKERKMLEKKAKKESKKEASSENKNKSTQNGSEEPNRKKRKEPTEEEPVSNVNMPVNVDIKKAMAQALSTHEQLAQKSSIYRSMFGSDKKAKLQETPEERFIVAGTHRAYL